MIKKLLSTITLFIILFTSLTIYSQEKMYLSLDQCIEIAQKNSPAAKIAIAKYEAEEWNYKAFRAGLYPQLSLDMTAPQYNRSINPIVLDDGTRRFITQQQALSSLNLSLKQELPWTGGRFMVSSGIQRLDLFGNPNSLVWQSTPFIFQFQQPLFQHNTFGWQSDLNDIRYKEAQSEISEELEGVAVDASKYYFDFYIARINLQIAQTNYMVNDTVYTISKGRYNVGKIAENELLQSELKLMEAKTALSSAELELKKAEESLRIQLDLSNDVQLETLPPKEINPFDIKPEFAVEQAKNNRSNTANYEFRRLQAESELNRAEANSGFNGNITASFGYNQTSSAFANIYVNTLDYQFFNLSLHMPIFTWGKGNAQIEAKLANQRAVENSVTFEENEFYKIVYYQAIEVMQLSDQVLLSAKSDEIAEKRYTVAKNRYLIGKIDITNLFIAQNEKDMAKRNYIETQKQYWIAYHTLRQLTLYNFQEEKVIKATFNN
ncbi:MAG: TolC family protein [Bacteroidota bacterium]